jgi:hypothetical protein
VPLQSLDPVVGLVVGLIVGVTVSLALLGVEF